MFPAPLGYGNTRISCCTHSSMAQVAKVRMAGNGGDGASVSRAGVWHLPQCYPAVLAQGFLLSSFPCSDCFLLLLQIMQMTLVRNRGILTYSNTLVYTSPTSCHQRQHNPWSSTLQGVNTQKELTMWHRLLAGPKLLLLVPLRLLLAAVAVRLREPDPTPTPRPTAIPTVTSLPVTPTSTPRNML